MHHVGSSAWICPKHLTKLIGMQNGLHGGNIEFRGIWFGYWETALQKYSIWKGFDNWIVEAAGREHGMLMKRDFVFFTLHNR